MLKIVKLHDFSFIIFLTALILRLTNVLEISQTNPFNEELLIDAKAYDSWGKQIASGDIIGQGVFYQDPLYPYFLGLIYYIFGHKLFIVFILQGVVGAVSALLVYLIGLRLINKHVGLIAAVLWALHPTIIFYEGLLMKEGLVVFLVLLTIHLLIIANERQGLQYFFLGGGTIGLTALARGNILLFIPFVILWRLFEDRKMFWKSSIVLLFGLLVVLMPVAIRNKLVGGEFVLTTSQAGANFYWGNNKDSTGTLLTAPTFVRSKPPYEKEDFANEAMRISGRKMSDTEISRFWFKKGIEFIYNHPKQYLLLLYQKLRLLLNYIELSDNYQYYYYKKLSTLLKYSPVSFGLICSLGLTGMVLAIMNWRKLLLLYLLIFSYSLSLLLFLISTRYRLPLVPVLTIFAAIAIYWIWERLRKVELSSLTYATTLLAIFGFFAWSEVPWVTHWNKVDVMALEGFELMEKGDIENAEIRFKEVIKLSPLDNDGHLGLGEIYFKKRRYLEAVNEFKISLREEPRSALLYSKIGFSYVYAGEFDKGIEALYKSIELEPNQSSSYFGLSMAFGEKGLHQESQKYLNEYNRHKGEATDF